jgi:hypothetical protein
MVRALCFALLLVPAFATAQQKPSGEPGRYQVVNGRPDMVRTIMLLDTVTGETWVICADTDGNMAWCKMPRTNSSASPPDEARGGHAGN